MASSCGIHIDQQRFHVVALEGSAKKHKLMAQGSGEIPPGSDPVVAVAEELRRLKKDAKLKEDNVHLAVDSGLAAFRYLTLPFDDRSKIEDVLKFEIESDLPQWDIDDIVVDFLVLSTKSGVESNLLVTAIPKARLQRQLEACEKGGLEANEAELDGTALFDAARSAGVLSEEGAQILVHVGDSTTTVVVADGGRLASIRAIRAGGLPHIAPSFEDEEDEEEVESSVDPEQFDEQARERLEQTSRRIRRELGRTISGVQTVNPIEAIYVCGHELDDLREETLFDTPVEALEAGPWVGDEAMPQELTIAYGAALRGLGGGALKPHLRREDLKFTGKFERLELPLAVFSLLLFTLLAVELIVINKQILWRDEGDLAQNWPGDMQIWLQASKVHLLPDPESGWPGRVKDPPPDLVKYLEEAERGDDERRTKFQELGRVRQILTTHVVNLKKKLNIGAAGADEVQQPQSALEGMTLVLGAIDALGDQLGRFGIRGLQADFQQGRQGNPDHVGLRLDMDFFADDALTATRHYNALKRAVEGEPWCVEFAERPTKPFDDGKGISVDGIAIQIDVDAARSME